MDFDASNLRSDQQKIESKTGLDAATIEQQVAQTSQHREGAGYPHPIQVWLDDGNDVVCPMEASVLTTVSICCTVVLAAHKIYRRHSATRHGSSMVSDAILFYEQHGPRSKTGLPAKLAKREQRIRFFQEEIRRLNDELAALDETDDALRFDADTGLFHLKG